MGAFHFFRPFCGFLGHRSAYPCVYVCICIHLCVLSFSLCVHICLSVSLCLSVCLTVYLSLSLSLSLSSLSLFVCPSTIVNQEGAVSLNPSSGNDAQTFVNGTLVTKKTVLHHVRIGNMLYQYGFLPQPAFVLLLFLLDEHVSYYSILPGLIFFSHSTPIQKIFLTHTLCANYPDLYAGRYTLCAN